MEFTSLSFSEMGSGDGPCEKKWMKMVSTKPLIWNTHFSPNHR